MINVLCLLQQFDTIQPTIMKITTAILICLLLATQNLAAQVKNIHRVSNKIPDSLVMEKIIGVDTVKSVDEKYFKEGWNVFHLAPGKFMYIDYKSNVVRGFLLSDTSGIVRGAAFFSDDKSVPFWCAISQCSCKGLKECEGMFAAGECKYNKVCIGNTCFCTKPYKTIKSKIRVENN
ncbi:hypothetical protein CAP36_08425 [Chitinophagaceae bacterium IBVUCB2]|nr:hypothetical protein CAP36_08425 [Chitinophagaceae bacterium IBVUCB2]